jgi:xanthine dehydrogenase small subunit
MDSHSRSGDRTAVPVNEQGNQLKEHTYNRISFWLNGIQRQADVAPGQTVLEFLQQKEWLFGTKCSCNEGDCGACTVVVARPADGKVLYEAVNSCLYNAAKLHGRHLITIEGLGTPDNLHPIQQAMLDFHATQCGYCSPGFVMSLFALLSSQSQPSEEDILAALEGNLCRCTGYDSILQAARTLAENNSSNKTVPEWCRKLEPELLSFSETATYISDPTSRHRQCERYLRPASLAELDDLIKTEQGYVLLNGGTDVMVQMNIQRREYPLLLDLSGIKELEGITLTQEGVRVGAGVTYSELLGSEIINDHLFCLNELVRRVASMQIRNFATLAGNVANASPIGDTLPLLLVLNAWVELHSPASERKLPLQEFFLDYRKTALHQNEIISAVIIPVPGMQDFIRTNKSAKRKAVDISSVVSAVRIVERDGKIKEAELAFGGVAVLPRVSKQFYKAMQNMELQGLHPHEIGEYVAAEFSPITDVRGSSKYRRILMRNHVEQYLREFLQGRAL